MEQREEGESRKGTAFTEVLELQQWRPNGGGGNLSSTSTVGARQAHRVFKEC